MKEMIRCNHCGQLKEVREFKTADSSVLSDSCSTCCIVIDSIRRLVSKKEHYIITEESFIKERERLLLAYGIRPISLF